jgi:hypothetical protein
MKKSLLMWDETLFREPEVFELDYVPEQFQHREDQMKELAFQVRPGLKGARPLNTVCRGLPGTGKTTSVKKIFSEIEETTKKLIPVYVNCQIDNTKFAIFSQIYRKLAGHLPPASGTSFKQVFDAIARIMQKEDAVLLVCLDDANYLLYENEMNKVLYTLLRSHEAYPGTRIGVILIISDMNVDLVQAVDARVVSVFRPTEVYFPPYKEVIPKDCDKKVTLKREAVLGAIRRAALLTTEEARSVRLDFSKDALVLTSEAPEAGKAEVKLAVEYSGDKLSIAFNPNFLMDVLRVLTGEDVFMEMKDPTRPAVLREDGDYLYVVMPINIMGE